MKILVFNVGTCRYGLDLKSVQEILEAPPLFPIPLAPSWLGAAINFHNRVVPVGDLAFLLHVPAGVRGSRIIVLETEAGILALKNFGSLKIITAEMTPEGVPSGSNPEIILSKGVSDTGEAVFLLDASNIVATLSAMLASERIPRRREGRSDILPFLQHAGSPSSCRGSD